MAEYGGRLGSRELRRTGKAERFVSSRITNLRVSLNMGDLKYGNTRLARTKVVARPSDIEIPLGDHKTVGGLRHGF